MLVVIKEEKGKRGREGVKRDVRAVVVHVGSGIYGYHRANYLYKHHGWNG